MSIEYYECLGSDRQLLSIPSQISYLTILDFVHIANKFLPLHINTMSPNVLITGAAGYMYSLHLGVFYH
jgi:hypothetical protein